MGECAQREKTPDPIATDPRVCPDLFFDVRIPLGTSPAISHSEESLVLERA